MNKNRNKCTCNYKSYYAAYIYFVNLSLWEIPNLKIKLFKMNTKLTLTIEATIIEKAKKYAKSKGSSLSGIIANYLKVITNQEKKSEIELTPLVKSVKGSLSAPLNFEYKKGLAKGLAEKCQFSIPMPEFNHRNSQFTQIIQKLDLQPHPEGGFFKETYRSEGKINADNLGINYQGERNYSTCIYFLLTSDAFSAFHRIHQDEIWHFYSGSPIHIHTISEDGIYTQTMLGSTIENGEIPQHVVAGGSWFGATVIREADYSLVGCTVAPGFDFLDFELSSRNELISRFPQHKEIITRLTRDS